MRRITLFATALLTAGLAFSCDKAQGPETSSPLKISVTSEDATGTRATLYGGATAFAETVGLVGFKGTDKIVDDTATKGTTYWETTGTYTFSTPVTLGVFAYYPSSIAPTATSTGLSLNYTLPKAAANQSDIMMGYASEEVSKTDMNVALTLKHALTSVVFKYGDVPSSNFAIDSISVRSIYKSGTCSFSSTEEFEWTSLSDTTGRCQGIPAAVTPAKDSYLGDGATFTLIPQSNEGFRPTIKVYYTFNDVSRCFKYTPSTDIAWERGKTYTFVIAFNTMTITVTCEDFNGGSWYTHGSDTNAGQFAGENW